MKKLMIFTFALICVFTCGACKHTNDSIINKTIVKDKTYEIIFDFENVDSIVYLEDDDVYLLHYDDPDCFDLDNLAFIIGRDEWYTDYIIIDIEEEIVSRFLYDYINYKNTKDFWEKESLNNQYIIIEKNITFGDGTKDIIFYVDINADTNGLSLTSE